MKKYLYHSYKGFDITTHSYSAGAEFNRCKKLYYLGRVKGWTEKVRRASLEFGIAVESSIQTYHANGCKPGATAEHFSLVWEKFEHVNLEYSDREGGWADLLSMGIDMGRLYEVMLPRIPIQNPRFQLNFRKEVFPGSELAGIETTAYVDMVLDTNPPMIVDIKTASQAWPENPGLLKLDKQLREYAWISGINRVAFLWFVKVKPTDFRTGQTATLLAPLSDNSNLFVPGDEVTVLETIPDWGKIRVCSAETYAKFKEKTAGLKGKEVEEAKKTVEFAMNSSPIDEKDLTKQKLQWIEDEIPSEELPEIGREIGTTIADIVSSNEENHWPVNPGVRFPDNHCLTCKMLPICTGNDNLRNETLVLLGPDPKPIIDEKRVELLKELLGD